jgi:hypothetical protein
VNQYFLVTQNSRKIFFALASKIFLQQYLPLTEVGHLHSTKSSASNHPARRKVRRVQRHREYPENRSAGAANVCPVALLSP